MSPLLALLLTANPALQAALEAARARPDAHLAVAQWAPPACQGAFSVPSPIEASGRVPVKVRGARCDDWGWATVTVTAPAAVLTRDVRPGEVLGPDAWKLAPVELRRGLHPLTRLDAAASATRALKQGTPLLAEHVRLGPPPGTPVLVRAIAGGLVVEQRGTITPCSAGQVCATLSNGRRVMGQMDAEVLVLELGSATPGGQP